MLPTTIHEAPALDSFTPLAEHQSQTPTSFYNSKPVLHYHTISLNALVSRENVSKLPVFKQQEQATEGSAEADGNVVEALEVFVSSENLTLFNAEASSGISIPYQAISLHAIQRLDDPSNPGQQIQGLYMQLELSDPYSVSDEEDSNVVDLTLIPSTGVQALFEAVSTCSNLHPDPSMDDDENMEEGNDSRIVFEGNVGYEGVSGLPGVQIGTTDGGLPPPFPGSGGWITAENVSEYFDEEGNWIGENGENAEGLGEGAGRVRTRDEADGNGVNGHDAVDEEDSKRPRTD